MISWGWIILIVYVLGFFISWVVAFRLMAMDEYMGVNTTWVKTPGDLVGAIAMVGFTSMMISFFWPIVALIFVIYRKFVHKVVTKDGS